MTGKQYTLGIDVGSTTVKMVLVDLEADKILWRDYQRHETKQPEKVLEFLKRIEEEHPSIPKDSIHAFITGSGGKNVARHIGAKFVQEVNAVCLAVEKLYPDTGSVIELGGQDAKIIIFKEDPETGRKKKIPSMNDKCAGGTGAVIDKINAKLRIPADELSNQAYHGVKLHHVAGKCGVFAETDINSLQKQGIPNNELMASLFEAIIGQNLSVLTRGHTLRPNVLLLGGPNTYIRGMREAWEENIPLVWAERDFPLPEGVDPKSLIIVPDNAQYFAAIGAVEFGKEEEDEVGQYQGYSELEQYINVGRLLEKKGAGHGLSSSTEELESFLEKYKKIPFTPASFIEGQVVEAFLGIDGGSTSTKAVLLDKDKNVLVKAYQLSKGNPIEDTMDIVTSVQEQVELQGATLNILGVGTTGYAKDVLSDVLGADAAIVETVAHTESALQFYDEVDVICDVGGQDIKIMILNNRQVKDFKLNTQCSAGNGYFLQSTSQDFGIPVENYATEAFGAESMPDFGYGCAVFMQSDIVDFQRQGWKKEEIMAGLANVLPKNIWLYVSQIPNLSKLGTNFVLQGGTQHNMAAVKSQVDFIESRFRGKAETANIIVHEHCGESGAIGAGIEAIRLWENGRETTFIGLESSKEIAYQSTTSEDTRCYFCKNKCLRTFIDVKIDHPIEDKDEQFTYKMGAQEPRPVRFYSRSKEKKEFESKVPLEAGAKRLIVGNSCEKGLVEDVNDMREIKKGLDAKLDANPNFIELAAKEIFQSFQPEVISDAIPKIQMTANQKERKSLMENRNKIRIGIPRVLNMYSTTPLFTGYFESLGLPYKNLVFSDYTTEKLYKDGIKRGSIDPCFPSKLGIPHVHNLIYKHHKRKPLDIIFFPMIDDLPTDLKDTQDCRACPTVTGTPETVKAAFIKEGDIFKSEGISYMDTFVNVADKLLFARQMFQAFKDILGLSKVENDRAVAAGYKALDDYTNSQRQRARQVLDQLEAEQKLGLVVLGRPYHGDPGINHEILVEFQKLGYPVFTQDSLPIDEDLLDRLFGDEVKSGVISHPLDISDAWKNSYSENTNRKLWGAKFTARHPNLVALELSNFKCGHDSPIYSVVEEIVEKSGTPIFNFKDLDENKPTGSIKIRVETISYFLTRYLESRLDESATRKEIEAQLEQFRTELSASVTDDEVELQIVDNSSDEYTEKVLTHVDAV
ncbi:MAG: CoA activase [Candidatus Marinimicrobia bacterium]|jgi:predicted CoA-substrate-specific enzyme activase|nr:CoA activase [Candidatus Neomarinimicrobiota bacterium]MBT4361662.1 CoA activase [Candidatus Neomarinimicrobiota bacterium]MBT4713974.1 CoA activase [Candidatus Neomarinimicrobiota bacterium]MBT4947070.1 CoA activase [Candidatus Neomarinimicrobiota bacterium]MBT5268432.1 CoA activase [Candidatus Neomarinimicrobiota bacterium]